MFIRTEQQGSRNNKSHPELAGQMALIEYDIPESGYVWQGAGRGNYKVTREFMGLGLFLENASVSETVDFRRVAY